MIHLYSYERALAEFPREAQAFVAAFTSRVSKDKGASFDVRDLVWTIRRSVLVHGQGFSIKDVLLGASQRATPLSLEERVAEEIRNSTCELTVSHRKWYRRIVVPTPEWVKQEIQCAHEKREARYTGVT